MVHDLFGKPVYTFPDHAQIDLVSNAGSELDRNLGDCRWFDGIGRAP